MFLFLLLFFLSITATLGGTELKFNYQPAKNNLETFSVEELKQILPKINGVKDFSCKGNICKINLYPLLISYSFKGFSPFIQPKLERYLGLKTFYRYSEEILSSSANNIAFFLRNNGYLDATVKSVLIVNKKGFAKLKIIGSEGKLYLWGGFQFNGTKCFSPLQFYRNFKKPFGIPFSYLELYNAIDLAQELCKKRGYFESFIYYSEPFAVKQQSLFHFFWKNFKTNPFLTIDFLSQYLDILLSNPLRGIYFLFKPLNAVYPTIEIHTVESKLKISFKGNRYFSKHFLETFVKNTLKKESFLSLISLQNELLNLYHSSGFFDVKIEIRQTDKVITVKITEGRRYKIKLNFIPPIKGLNVKVPPFYEKKFERKLLRDVEKFLQTHRWLYKKIKLHKEINRQKKVVYLTLFVEGLKKVKISTKREIYISNPSLRKLVKKLLEKESPYNLIVEKEKIHILRKKLFLILKKFGCFNPQVLIEVKNLKTRLEVLERVSCKRILKFKHTAYWVEGRIRKKELDYLMPDFYGKRFNQKLIDILHNRLAYSNLFKSYTVKLVKDKGIIPLIEGVEKKPLTIEGQLGLSSDEGYLGDFLLKLTDPFGFGSIFTLQYLLSSKRTLYRFSYLDDYFFSKHLFVGGALFKKYEEHRDFDLTGKGYSTTIGYHLNLYTDVSLNFISLHFTLNSKLTNLSEGNLKKLTLSGEIYYPIYKGLVKKGLLNAFIHFSTASFGKQYFKTLVGINLSFLSKDIYNHIKISGGYVSPQAPIFEKFYLGGIKNLKGYSYESIAPEGGGEIFWYLGTEWGFPLFKPLYLFGGLDFGNVVKKSQNPFGEIKKDVFIGVGSVTAAGPIRFVIALPLKNKLNLQDIKYLFLVGFNF